MISSSHASPESSCTSSISSGASTLREVDEGDAELAVANRVVASAASDVEEAEFAKASDYSDQINDVLDHDESDTWSLF